MKNRIFFLAVLILAFLLQPLASVAAINLPAGVPESINVGEKTYKVNVNIAEEKGYLVYGTAADILGNDYKNTAGDKVSASTKGAIPRYLGYDIYGNKYSNFDFPVDADSGRDPWEKSWIKYPWDEGKCTFTPFNNDAKAAEWLDRLKWPGWTGAKLKDYLLIQSPPTEWAPGTCVGWHIDNIGKVWYQVFSIESDKKLDLKVKVSGNDNADGCFLDVPKKVGNNMEVYVIRGPREKITEPIYVPIKIYLLQNVDENIQFGYTKIPTNIGWGDLIFDEVVKITPEKPYWVKKITYPVPLVNHESGIFVQTGPREISAKEAVVSDTWNNGTDILTGTHTMSDSEFMDYLPWTKIEAEFGIKRLQPEVKK